MDKIFRQLQDESGVETLEWIVVGALIVAIGIVVYQQTLQGQLVNAINAIGTTVSGLASS